MMETVHVLVTTACISVFLDLITSKVEVSLVTISELGYNQCQLYPQPPVTSETSPGYVLLGLPFECYLTLNQL